MASRWNRISSSKKTADKGKGKAGESSSHPMVDVNLVDDMGCYDFGEYRATDLEFSQDEYPPCPPGFEHLNPGHGEEEGHEEEDAEVEEIPAREAEDYAGVGEDMEQQIAGNTTSLPP